MSEDICRPGGSIYRDADFRDDGTVAGSGWSVSQNDSPPVPNNPFVNANDNAGGEHRCLSMSTYAKTLLLNIFSLLCPVRCIRMGCL